MTELLDAEAGRLPARGEFDIELRHRCRQCRSKLPAPTENPRRAFCTPGCYSSFHLKRCVVCENDKPAGRSDRKFCRRPKCRTEYYQNRDRFGPITAKPNPTPSLSTLSSKSAQPTGTKIDDLADRKWRQIAGPELSASAFHCAMVGADETVEAARRTNARFWREAGAGALIGPPVNLLGGYKFPNAPDVELTSPAEPAPVRVADSSHAISDDLSIPDFLKVTP